jgi:hypothetical protein
VGLRFIPLAAGSLVGSNVAARLTERFSLRGVMLVGMGLITGGLAVFAVITTSAPFGPVAAAFAALGLGLGLVVAPASNAIMGTVPADKVGAGSGLRSTVQLLGGSFGVAIVGSLAVSRYHQMIEHSIDGALRSLPPPTRAAVESQIGDAVGVAHNLSPSTAQAVRDAASAAFVSGMRLSALVSVGVMLVAMVAAALWIPDRPSTITEDAEPTVAMV